jgi:hypothetical protein
MKTCSKTWISHHSNDLDYLLVVAVVALVLVTFRDTLGGSSSRKRTRTNSLHHVFLVAFVLFVFLFLLLGSVFLDALNCV